jgi:hypothetical protein
MITRGEWKIEYSYAFIFLRKPLSSCDTKLDLPARWSKMEKGKLNSEGNTTGTRD